MVYTVGPQADPGGLVRGMTEALAQLGLEAFAVNHEFMNSQYEINLRHADALTAADRAFRLKAAVKDIAAQQRAGRDVHGQAVQRPGRLGHAPAPLARPRRRATRSTRPARPTASARELRRVHRRRARARARADGVPEPDDQRLPPHPARLARADARQLGLGQPRDVHPHPARARRRDAARDPRRRRRRQPVPGDRRRAGRRRARHARASSSRRRRSRATPTAPSPTSPARRCPRSLEEALDALEADAVLRERARRRRSSRRSWRSSASRSSATARGSRTGRSTSTSTTSRAAMTHDPSFIDLSDHDAFVDGRPARGVRRAAPRGPRALEPRARRRPGFWAVTRYEDIRHVHRNVGRLLVRDRRHLARGPRRPSRSRRASR